MRVGLGVYAALGFLGSSPQGNAQVIFSTPPDSVAPGYKGGSFAALARKLSIKPKGAYETTEHFEARIPVVSPGWHAIVTSLSSQDCSGFSVEYEADTGRFFLTAETNEDLALVISCRKQPVGRYIGENAFGVKRSVRSELTEKQLLAPTFRAVGQWVPRSYAGSLACAPEHARGLRARLAVLVLFKPQRTHRDEYTETRSSVTRATLDEPVEHVLEETILHVSEVMLLVFDRVSGKVLVRLTPT